MTSKQNKNEKYLKNAPKRLRTARKRSHTRHKNKRRARSIEWTEQAESLLKHHKVDMQSRLTKFASTTPWDEIIMGSIDKIRNNSPYKDLFKVSKLNYGKQDAYSRDKRKPRGKIEIDKKLAILIYL